MTEDAKGGRASSHAGGQAGEGAGTQPAVPVYRHELEGLLKDIMQAMVLRAGHDKQMTDNEAATRSTMAAMDMEALHTGIKRATLDAVEKAIGAAFPNDCHFNGGGRQVQRAVSEVLKRVAAAPLDSEFEELDPQAKQPPQDEGCGQTTSPVTREEIVRVLEHLQGVTVADRVPPVQAAAPPTAGPDALPYTRRLWLALDDLVNEIDKVTISGAPFAYSFRDAARDALSAGFDTRNWLADQTRRQVEQAQKEARLQALADVQREVTGMACVTEGGLSVRQAIRDRVKVLYQQTQLAEGGR